MKSQKIWLVKEVEGGHVVRAFTAEEDAKNFFYWSCVHKELTERYYTIDSIILEDWSKK